MVDIAVKFALTDKAQGRTYNMGMNLGQTIVSDESGQTNVNDESGTKLLWVMSLEQTIVIDESGANCSE